MAAFLFIQEKRKVMERIDFVSTLRLSMNAGKADLEKVMDRWARSADIHLTFEE